MEQAGSGLERLNTLVYALLEARERAEEHPLNERDQEMLRSAAGYKQKFEDCMDDDFNTADALAALFELTREANIYLKGEVNLQVVSKILDIFEERGKILGFFTNIKKEDLAPEIEALIQKRQEARKNKDWATADRIRDELLEKGIILEDTPQGVRWKKKS
ncbi:MAG: hypothetical protein CVU88_06175 [Firmicutes bacterium HGW-Firmicutes-13]|nr:MAG: hypothetical protein CVU88_06175 [Firmicutes bacterium HGW-Firmicutes-13]